MRLTRIVNLWLMRTRSSNRGVGAISLRVQVAALRNLYESAVGGLEYRFPLLLARQHRKRLAVLLAQLVELPGQPGLLAQ